MNNAKSTISNSVKRTRPMGVRMSSMTEMRDISEQKERTRKPQVYDMNETRKDRGLAIVICFQYLDIEDTRKQNPDFEKAALEVEATFEGRGFRTICIVRKFSGAREFEAVLDDAMKGINVEHDDCSILYIISRGSSQHLSLNGQSGACKYPRIQILERYVVQLQNLPALVGFDYCMERIRNRTDAPPNDVFRNLFLIEATTFDNDAWTDLHYETTVLAHHLSKFLKRNKRLASVFPMMKLVAGDIFLKYQGDKGETRAPVVIRNKINKLFLI